MIFFSSITHECKLLGVIIIDDLKWNAHVEYVIAKAAKRLFALRLLKRGGVMPKDILKVYLCNVRSVLEYAAQVWQDIPAYLSDAIESIQRTALRIILPNSSYQQALGLTNLLTLANRRTFLSKKLMAEMRDESHPISFLAPKVTIRKKLITFFRAKCRITMKFLKCLEQLHRTI